MSAPPVPPAPPAPGPRPGPVGDLVHLGLVYGSSDELVEAAHREVLTAVEAGDDVHLSVDRGTARGFREALGPAAERVSFPPPSEIGRGGPAGVLERLRAMVGADRRTFLLGQTGRSGLGSAGLAVVEDGVNLVLGDLPLTLVCTCARDGDPALGAVSRCGHPDVLVDGARRPNPDYRRPAPTSPAPGVPVGDTALRLDLAGTAALRTVRGQVARLAGEAGLSGHRARAAVLAVHEAAVLACGEGPGALEVQYGRRRFVTDLRGAGSRTVPAAERLRVLRQFCDEVGVRDEPDGSRVVRVVTALDRSAPAGSAPGGPGG